MSLFDDILGETGKRPWNPNQRLCFTEKETATIFAMAGLAIFVEHQDIFARANVATLGLSLADNVETIDQCLDELRKHRKVPEDYYQLIRKCLIFRLECQKLDKEGKQ